MQIAPVEGHGGQRLAVQLGSYQRVHLGHVAAQPQQPGQHMAVVGHVMCDGDKMVHGKSIFGI